MLFSQLQDGNNFKLCCHEFLRSSFVVSVHLAVLQELQLMELYTLLQYQTEILTTLEVTENRKYKVYDHSFLGLICGLVIIIQMIRNVLEAVDCSWLWFCFLAFSTNQLECLLLLLRGFHFSLHIHLKKQTERCQPCPFLNQFLQATLQTSLLLPPMG